MAEDAVVLDPVRQRLIENLEKARAERDKVNPTTEHISIELSDTFLQAYGVLDRYQPQGPEHAAPYAIGKAVAIMGGLVDRLMAMEAFREARAKLEEHDLKRTHPNG